MNFNNYECDGQMSIYDLEMKRSQRVALIDVDGHNFPNLPLMKLSAWHKQQGDSVEWYAPLTACNDKPDMV